VKLKRLISYIMSKKAYLLTGFFGFICLISIAQNQKISDSLKIIYNQKNYNIQNQLKILKTIAESETNINKKLDFSSILVKTATEFDSAYYIFSGYLQKGNAYRLKSSNTKALKSYFKAAKVATNRNLRQEQSSINIAIADVYSIIGDHTNAVFYYKLSLRNLKKENDSINIASAQLNLGDDYYNQNKLDSALIYFKESRKIFRALKSEIGIAYNLGNLGLVFSKKNENKRAENNLNKAINVLTKLSDYYPICVYLGAMSEIYKKKGLDKKALIFATRSLNFAKKYGLKEQISTANLKISGIYEQEGKILKSFRHYKDYIKYKDTINSVKVVQKMANMRTNYEISKKQLEVDLLNHQKKTQKIIVIATGFALFLIALLALGLYKRNRYIQKTNKIIEREKNRSDNLLLNILPEETAFELKENGVVKPKKFDSVTVLFTDFKGFTQYSEKLSPEELVKSIDFYFSNFDKIIEKYNLEKIKTVGDSYMCAGGLPFQTTNHALKIIQAAFEIVEFVEKAKISNKNKLTTFDIRIGINTGPVVAGVVGTKKFSYDIWGDTVNVASRMETASETGKINISENTFNLINGDFKCTYRGSIKVKNRGFLKMYFINNHT